MALLGICSRLSDHVISIVCYGTQSCRLENWNESFVVLLTITIESHAIMFCCVVYLTAAVWILDHPSTKNQACPCSTSLCLRDVSGHYGPKSLAWFILFISTPLLCWSFRFLGVTFDCYFAYVSCLCKSPVLALN